MIITNETGLPQSFVEMAKRDYILAPNEYRVTSLLKGVRETILERRHDAEIKRDVSDMIWLLFGTAVHGILERQKEGTEQFKEERLKIPFDGYTLSGQFDLYDASEAALTDYKTASVWKVIYGKYEDWRRQLLIYAYMLRSIGFPVKRGEIIAILKDHSLRDSKVKSGYPKLAVQKVPFRFNDRDYREIEDFLHKRFALIRECESLSDDMLPICTPDERFNSGDKYAVMKKGRKKSMRNFDKEEDAQAYMEANGGDYIEPRLGEDKKCIDYCACNQFCSYYRQHVAKEGF